MLGDVNQLLEVLGKTLPTLAVFPRGLGVRISIIGASDLVSIQRQTFGPSLNEFFRTVVKGFYPSPLRDPF